MDAVELLREQFKQAHDTLEGVMAEVEPEQVHWIPPGTALPIGAEYVHVIVGEDAILNELRQVPSLLATAFAKRNGVSELPPRTQDWGDWARQVKIDLPTVREYAQAVYVRTDEYLAGLKSADLGAEIQMFGMPWKLGGFLGLMLGHVNNHAGEISCLKGLQGAKGYPY